MMRPCFPEFRASKIPYAVGHRIPDPFLSRWVLPAVSQRWEVGLATPWTSDVAMPALHTASCRDLGSSLDHRGLPGPWEVGFCIVIGLPPVRWMVFNRKSHWKGWWLGVPLWLRKPPSGFREIPHQHDQVCRGYESQKHCSSPSSGFLSALNPQVGFGLASNWGCNFLWSHCCGRKPLHTVGQSLWKPTAQGLI